MSSCMRNLVSFALLAPALLSAALSGCGGSSPTRDAATMTPETMTPETMTPETMTPEDEMTVNWPEWPFEPMTAQANWPPSSFSTTNLTSEQIGEKIQEIGADIEFPHFVVLENGIVIEDGTNTFRAWPPGEFVLGGVHAGRQSEARAIMNVNGVVLFQARESFNEVSYGTTGVLGYGGLLENSWFVVAHETFLSHPYPEDGVHVYPATRAIRGFRPVDPSVLTVNAHWRGAMVGIVGDNVGPGEGGQGDFYDRLLQVRNPGFAHGEAFMTIREIDLNPEEESPFNMDISFRNIRNVATDQRYPDMEWSTRMGIYDEDAPVRNDPRFIGIGATHSVGSPVYGRYYETLSATFGGSNYDEVVGYFSRRSPAETEVRYGSFGARRTDCAVNPCLH